MHFGLSIRHSRYVSRVLPVVYLASFGNMSNLPDRLTTSSLKAANAQPFSSMRGKLNPSLLEGLDAMGFEYMTPVQKKVLAELPSLNSDCLVQAKTGTGKTIAFLLPAVHSLLQHSPALGKVSILILSPTRELALQIAQEARQLVAKMKRPLQIHTAFGGTGRAENLAKFTNGDPKILVATPGRLKDYLSEKEVREKFESIQTLILDEADAMLEAGFLPDILHILRALPAKDTARWQGMCFSATLPPKISEVLSNVLNEDYSMISTIDSSEPPTLAKVPQYSVIIPHARDTFNALLSLINIEINASKEDPKIIVFGMTANLVALYAKLFQGQTRLNIFELHSRLSQPQRTRTTAAFKDASSGVMFATDVIGRGMDFPDVTLVVQAGLPADADAYTHRVGRTARAGKDGRAIILLTQAESYFIHVNRQFPITSYPRSASILEDAGTAEQVSQAMELIDDNIKRKAYSAYLGSMKPFLNKLKINPAGLVKLANDFALEGMKCEEVPEMEKSVIGKMGLKGVPGLRISNPRLSTPGPSKGANRKPAHDIINNGDRVKRARHQGPPEILINSTGMNDYGTNVQGDHVWGGRNDGSRGHGMRAPSSGGDRGGRRYG